MSFRHILFFSVFWITVSATSQYSDEFTRKYFPLIFASTEAKNASNCLTKVFNSFELKRHINVACDEEGLLDKCSGISFAAHDEKAIVLSFRGTKGVLQLFVEADEVLFRNLTSWPSGGKAGFYFARAFNLIWSHGMKDDFNSLVQKYPDYEIWIGGHSLGGSMASLASTFIVSNQLIPSYKTIRLITFGQPRTGDQQLADAHDKLIKYSYRVIHKRDIVPHIPFENLDGFIHHRNEIWYNNDMSTSDYKECNSQESIFCSNSHLDFEISDHHRYFGVFMSFYGRRNCTGDPSKLI